MSKVQVLTVAVSVFQGSTTRPAKADKNGMLPVILTALSGSLPNDAKVLSGTIADRAGLTVGSVCTIAITTGEQREYEGSMRNTYNYLKLADTGSAIATAEANKIVGGSSPSAIKAANAAFADVQD
jgi:hypothetical protein